MAVASGHGLAGLAAVLATTVVMTATLMPVVARAQSRQDFAAPSPAPMQQDEAAAPQRNVVDPPPQPPANAVPEPAPAPRLPEPPAAPQRQQKRFSEWSTMRQQDGGQTVCFALGKARAGTSGKSAPSATGDGALVYVTSWPQSGVKAEVSILSGVPFTKGTPARLNIGSEAFSLSAHDNRAFIDNPIQELKLLEAMKRGSQMILTGQAEDGTPRTDTFSLSGFAAAFVHLTQGCP